MGESKVIGMLAAAFVCLFVGLSLIAVVSSEINGKTDLTPINNELLNINSAKYSNGATNTSVGFLYSEFTDSINTWRANQDECDLTDVTAGLVIRNGTITFVQATDYKVSSTNGTITFQQTNNVNGTLSNNTYVSYNYCADDYVAGWAGNMLVLVPGFFALALLGCSLVLFYNVGKETGIL